MSPKSLKNFLEQNCEIQDNQCINKTTKKIIRTCVPMHTFGHPCKIDAIQKTCARWHITLVEDAAESLGSFYKDKHTGTFGKLGAFSFNGNKIITSGGGGVIVTDDAALAKKAKHLTTTAKLPHPYEYTHDMIGYNYRMPNLNAALLVAQMEKLEQFLASKRKLTKEYANFFAQFDDIEFIREPKEAHSNYWLQAVMLQNNEEREAFLQYLNKHNVMTRPIWKLMSELEMFADCQKTDLSNAECLQERVVNLPSSARV